MKLIVAADDGTVWDEIEGLEDYVLSHPIARHAICNEIARILMAKRILDGDVKATSVNQDKKEQKTPKMVWPTM